MVFSYLYALFILFLSFGIGTALLTGLDKKFTLDSDFNVLLATVIGLVLLSLWGLLWAFWLPLNGISLLIGVILGMIVTLSSSGARKAITHQLTGKQKLPFILFTAGVLAITICYASSGPAVYDTGAYHLPIVKWLNEHGTVPGIANLDPHYGFASTWFYLSGLLDFGVFKGVPYHFLNAILMTIAIAWCAASLRRMYYGGRKVQDLFSIPLLVYLFFDKHTISSITPDLPVVVLGFITLFLLIEYETVTSQVSYLLSVVVLSLFTIGVKVSSLPLLIPFVVALYLLFRGRKKKGVVIGVSFSIAIVTVLLLRDWIITGHLLYPSTLSSLILQADWQIPAWRVEDITEHIKLWGKNNRYLTEGVAAFPGWIPKWFSRNISIHEYPFEMSSLLLIPVSIGLVIYQIVKRRLKDYKLYFVVAITGWVGLIFWFVNAPNPRFSSLWIATAIWFPILFQLYLLHSKFIHSLFTYAFLIFGLWFLVALAGESGVKNRVFGKQNHLLYSIDPAPSEPVKPYSIKDGTEVNIPVKGYRIWNTPLPGMRRPYYHITKRGNKLEDGFEPIPLPKKELRERYKYVQ